MKVLTMMNIYLKYVNMTPEKKVQNDIIKYLKNLEKLGKPIFIERRQAGGFSYKKGLPDLYVVCNGIHIEIEIKREIGGSRSTMQDLWCKRFNKLGIPYILATCVEDVKTFINEIL